MFYRNGRWYASVTLNCEPSRQRGDKLGGLDWGLETFATVATLAGTETIDNPRYLARTLGEIRRLKREYEHLRRLHRKVADQRQDFLHQTTARQLKPSQTCHACGRREKKPLGQRRHACPCGASCSRDENAARVLMSWAEQRLSGREPAEAWRELRPNHPLGESALSVKRETRVIA